jgi:predicted Fe-Mo cluster-binding NifX family protein
MKIAVPTRGNQVDDHFGHCESYTIFTTNADKSIEKSEILKAPKGCGCKSNIASILKEKGVDTMLAGNMGNGALNVLNRHGIIVYRGCSGDVEQITQNFLQGKVDDSGLSCEHHEHNCEK